jgi:cold-inducible RNA-binding protein
MPALPTLLKCTLPWPRSVRWHTYKRWLARNMSKMKGIPVLYRAARDLSSCLTLATAPIRRVSPANGRHLRSILEPRGRRVLPTVTFSEGKHPVTKLFVGNLPFTATEESVRELFSPHGTIESLNMITDRDTGRPRGFCFVVMSNADASRAIQALNGTDFNGRALKVSEAQDKDRSAGGRPAPRRY